MAPVRFPRAQASVVGPAADDQERARAHLLRVLMVTGDHLLAAESIKRHVGIIRPENPTATLQELRQVRIDGTLPRSVVLHGKHVGELSEQDWQRILRCKDILFARTSPKQKLEIVLPRQGQGEIVGVTGDGTNDSPALKRADLGIAMGISGSDVSRAAASMILMDDYCASVVTGNRLGRQIFSSLKLSIANTRKHLTPEIIPVILNLTMGLPLPMRPL